MEDNQIIELYFARDEAAIRETDCKYGKLCFSIAKNMLRNEEDSKECLNDTYFSTWNTIPPQRPALFKAFLCGITRNLSLKRLEHDQAQKRSPELQTSFEELEAVLSDEAIAKTAEDQEIGEIISEFLKTETKEYRMVFLRKYWFFDSIETISTQYGFSESKVKSMLFRTRKRLKAYLKKEGIAL